jgi:acyl carrier protein
MPIASRTPEGWPNRCPVCGADWRIEPSQPTGDAPCPSCGVLVWFDRRDKEREVTEYIAQKLGVPRKLLLAPGVTFQDLGADSLDIVELMMELEEVYELNISDEDSENLKTVEDIIEYILRRIDQRRTE